MSKRKMNLIPWLGVLGCLALAPGVKVAEAADATKVSHSQAAGAQPQLAEQDIWLRWKLAHDARKARAETKSTCGPASAKQTGTQNPLVAGHPQTRRP